MSTKEAATVGRWDTPEHHLARIEAADRLAGEIEEYKAALAVIKFFEEKHADLLELILSKPSGGTLHFRNMREAILAAARAMPAGHEFSPREVVRALENEWPETAERHRIDKKKAQDTLGRLCREPDSGLERVSFGVRGPHGRSPIFRRAEESDG